MEAGAVDIEVDAAECSKDVTCAGCESVDGPPGGTSDARFITEHCPVCEFGMTNQTAHKADENSLISDIRQLADIYQAVLDGFFAPSG